MSTETLADIWLDLGACTDIPAVAVIEWQREEWCERGPWYPVVESCRLFIDAPWSAEAIEVDADRLAPESWTEIEAQVLEIAEHRAREERATCAEG